MTKKGCILSAPLVFYNFDTQHAQFMNYIQITTKISVNNKLTVVIRLLPEQSRGRFTATLNYGTLSMAKRKGDSSAFHYLHQGTVSPSCSVRCRK